MPISITPHPHADRAIHRPSLTELGIVLKAAYELVLRPYGTSAVAEDAP